MSLTMPSGLAGPPSAPGSLTVAPNPRALLSYLDELRTWRDDLHVRLDSLDRRAQVASAPDVYTGDLTLALSMWESIDRRSHELIAVWDSGRVGPKELTHLAELIWSRLPDPLGNPSAFSLSETTALAAALEARLESRLSADSIAGSGAADRIAPLHETLTRCEALAATLGRHDGEAQKLASQLDVVLTGSEGPVAIGTQVAQIADAAELLERDLIKETSLRSAVQSSAAELGAKLVELRQLEPKVRAVAARCRDKIAAAPRLAVPDVARIGAVPAIPHGPEQPGAWMSAQSALEAYRVRINLVAAALAEAERRFATPLTERAELRGLADAYRAKAGAAGLAENEELGAEYEGVHAILWHAPCDLAAGRLAVDEYLRAVAAAVERWTR
jgi:hypothetical protein